MKSSHESDCQVLTQIWFAYSKEGLWENKRNECVVLLSTRKMEGDINLQG